MTYNRVALFDAIDAASHRLDPSRVFMAHDVGQLDGYPRTPESFDNVQVGPADARPTDADDNVARTFDFWLRHVLIGDELRVAQALVVVMEDCCFHTIRLLILVFPSPLGAERREAARGRGRPHGKSACAPACLSAGSHTT